MENNEIIERLKIFAGRNFPKLEQVAISNGVAYVSDGRIALVAILDSKHDDAIPKGFPIEGIKKYISEVHKCQNYFRLVDEEFKYLDKKFTREFNRLRINDEHDYNSRYTRAECPCCGELLYWDGKNEEFVRYREAYVQPVERDVTFWTRIIFDHGNPITIDVNFAYLRMIVSAFSDTLLFGVVPHEDFHLLCMQSPTGDICGVLMPLRIVDPLLVEDQCHYIHARLET